MQCIFADRVEIIIELSGRAAHGLSRCDSTATHEVVDICPDGEFARPACARHVLRTRDMIANGFENGLPMTIRRIEPVPA